MKIKEGFILREASGCYCVMYLGGELQFNGMITLNETGAFIWRAIEKGLSIEEIIKAICNEYEISYQQASNDFEIFLSKMRGAQIIE